MHRIGGKHTPWVHTWCAPHEGFYTLVATDFCVRCRNTEDDTPCSYATSFIGSCRALWRFDICTKLRSNPGLQRWAQVNGTLTAQDRMGRKCFFPSCDINLIFFYVHSSAQISPERNICPMPMSDFAGKLIHSLQMTCAPKMRSCWNGSTGEDCFSL